MENEQNLTDDALFAQEERCLKAKKAVARACVLRLAVSALLVFILAAGPRSALLWGLVGLVLLVNLAGLLPLAMEWKKLRRKYRELCSQETT